MVAPDVEEAAPAAVAAAVAVAAEVERWRARRTEIDEDIC